MRWPLTRSLGVYVALMCVVAGVAGWQWGEHQRFKQAAVQTLINRGRDITSTLGIVVSSQRRFGNLVAKDRIELALNGLVHPGELESIAILSATGETIASAGQPIELTTEIMRAGGVHWRDRELTLMNLMDLGSSTGASEENPPPTAVVVSDARLGKAFRSALKQAATSRSEQRAGTGTGSPPGTEAGPGIFPSPRFPYARPSWMEKEEYDALIKKQGVHSLIISLSTEEMRQAIRGDLLLRSLVSLLAGGAALISALSWRNLSRNADLQIRLVKAAEMNSHLAQMNFAAAGLAHETRNPLNLIRGLAQMITMETKEPAKLKEHASTIIEEADRVTVQLNEFIDFSKPREAHPAPVEVSRLVADVVRTLKVDIEDKQIALRSPTAPLTIAADEQLFRQALFNLLLNAVQAVEPGGEIEIRWSADAAGDALVEVADNGPGVPEPERANIFKPYVTMRPKGVGLGLAIVQQIIAAHRWEIVCVPNTPRGAVFRISHVKVAGVAA